MPEDKDKPSLIGALASLREQLGQDGHFTENAVSLLVQQEATARDLFRNPLEATLGLMDAMAGASSRVPQQIVDKIITLRQIIENEQLANAASKAAIYSSANERKALEETSRKGFPALRKVALNMSPPANSGEGPVNLGARIQALSPQR